MIGGVWVCFPAFFRGYQLYFWTYFIFTSNWTKTAISCICTSKAFEPVIYVWSYDHTFMSNLFRSYMQGLYLLASTVIPKYIESCKNPPNSQSSPFDQQNQSHLLGVKPCTCFQKPSTSENIRMIVTFLGYVPFVGSRECPHCKCTSIKYITELQYTESRMNICSLLDTALVIPTCHRGEVVDWGSNYLKTPMGLINQPQLVGRISAINSGYPK